MYDEASCTAYAKNQAVGSAAGAQTPATHAPNMWHEKATDAVRQGTVLHGRDG